MAKPGLDAVLLTLRLVPFLSFPSWWSQGSGFCLDLPGLQPAGPRLLRGSKMALPRPGLPADVSLMSLSFNAAVASLWHHHRLDRLKDSIKMGDTQRVGDRVDFNARPSELTHMKDFSWDQGGKLHLLRCFV